MSENERKTWIMYKRALRPVYFSENVFPTMTKVCQIDKYTAIVEDSYGFWKAHANTPYSYNTDIPPVWRAFDHNTGTHTKVMYYNTSFSESIITLTLPEGVQICPHNMTAPVAMMSSGTVEGYNPLTNAWEKIFTIGKMG